MYSVKDNGIGFDEKYKNRLFSPFQRLHSSADFEGSGIGLAIVRRIIARFGGQIWAESKPDKGGDIHIYFTGKINGYANQKYPIS